METMNNVDCRNTDFRGADLDNVLFWGCDLRHCNFSNANLTNAKIIVCDIRSVDFRGAIMTNIDLSGSVSNHKSYKSGGKIEREYDKWVIKILEQSKKIFPFENYLCKYV